MIKKTIINGLVFIEQTTFFAYRSEEDLQKDKTPFLITSNRGVFNNSKNKAKKIIQNEK